MTNTILSTIKPGAFFGITYYSNKESKDGSSLVKITKTVARTAINYAHTNGYVAPKSPRKANENLITIRPHSIHENTKTGNTLLTIYPSNIPNQTSVSYQRNGRDVSKAEFDSYLKKPEYEGSRKVVTVNCDHIISISQR